MSSGNRLGVYRYYDGKASCLYVGITSSLTKRHSEHMRKSEWSPEVYSLIVEWYDRFEEAEHREVELISELTPIHNVASKPREAVEYPEIGL